MTNLRVSVAPRAILNRVFSIPLLAGCFIGCATIDGPLRAQQVLFAHSYASMSDPDHWSMIIQGRIFEPAEGSPARTAIIPTLAPLVGASPSDMLFRSRAGHLISDSKRNTRVSVALDGKAITLAPSDAAGYFRSDVSLTNEQATRLARDGVITFESLPTTDNSSRFRGTAMLVPEEGLTVVTDMDDTIKETNVNNHAEAKANTFVRPFRPVAGMPDLYRAWNEAGGSHIHFHVVSAGPWQFHEPLRQFTEEAAFPPFTWDMRSVDSTDLSVLVDELLKADPRRLYVFKVARIRTLIERFPKRHFVLVGDSGERDPEVYATILSEFPDRIDAVFIRNVTGEGQTAVRYLKLFPGKKAADKLRVFADPGELPRRIGEPR